MELQALKPRRSLDESLPTMTYRDLIAGLESEASGDRHRAMIPFLISALQEQAPFLTGQLAVFEILRSGNCLADPNATPVFDG